MFSSETKGFSKFDMKEKNNGVHEKEDKSEWMKYSHDGLVFDKRKVKVREDLQIRIPKLLNFLLYQRWFESEKHFQGQLWICEC